MRHPLLPHRMPGQQPDPGLERSRLSRRVAGGGAQPSLDQQFPGVHRPRLSRALRGVLHAEHPGHARHDQDDRVRDHRPRVRGRVDPSRAARDEVRQVGRRCRLRPRRSRLRPAARASGPRRSCLRKTGQGRRPASLRHSRLQAREASRRPARRADGGRRRHLPLQRACRRDGERQGAGGAPRRDCACGRRRGLPRPAGPRARPRRSPFRDGVPAAAEPARFRRAAGDQQADPGQRQERRGDRRRRHGLRLHRHLDPPGRAQGDAARDPADAAKTRGQAA